MASGTAENLLQSSLASEAADAGEAEVEQLAAAIASQSLEGSSGTANGGENVEDPLTQMQAFLNRQYENGVLDREEFTQLRLLAIGEHNFMAEIVSMFCEDTDKWMKNAAVWLDQLPDAAETQRLGSLGRKRYDDFSIRIPAIGSVRSMGGGRLVESLIELRRCQKKLDQKGCREAFPQVLLDFAELKEVLNEYLRLDAALKAKFADAVPRVFPGVAAAA